MLLIKSYVVVHKNCISKTILMRMENSLRSLLIRITSLYATMTFDRGAIHLTLNHFICWIKRNKGKKFELNKKNWFWGKMNYFMKCLPVILWKHIPSSFKCILVQVFFTGSGPMNKNTLPKYRCFYCTTPTYRTEEYSEIVEHCVKGHTCLTLN